MRQYNMTLKKRLHITHFTDKLTVGRIKTGTVSGVSTGSNKTLIKSIDDVEKNIVFVDVNDC